MTDEAFFEQLKSQANVVLNDTQQQACTHYGKPLLLLSAPGTGKTTTTIAKIGYMIKVIGIAPQKILAITFSKAAAVDMQKKYQTFFPNEPCAVHFSTIHSLAFEIYRQYMLRNGEAFDMLDGKTPERNQVTIIRKLYRQFSEEMLSESEKDSIIMYITLLKNLGLTPAQFAKTKQFARASVPKFAEQMYEAYENYKRNAQPVLIDYDDMLVEALRILENDDAIRSQYQQRFEFLLMDEAQDTSYVQHRIAEILVENHQHIYMVADDDQTIYSFRGSSVDNLLNFSERFPNAEILRMEQNYRSTKTIVKTANRFIKNVRKRYDKNMFTENPLGDGIKVQRFASNAAQVQHILKSLETHDNLAEVAVLYRNNMSSIPFMLQLIRNDIPFYMRVTDKSFFNHFIVKDIRNYCRLIYGDKVKHAYILQDLRSRYRGFLKKAHFEQLNQFDPEDNLWEALAQLDNINERQKSFFKKSQSTFNELKDIKPLAALNKIFNELSYREALDSYVDFLKLDSDFVEDIITTIRTIMKESTSIPDFFNTLDNIEEKLLAAKDNRNANALQLSTFHAAKGLEYDTVYLVDLMKNTIPSPHEVKAFRDGDKEAFDEAYRLFYVAMTRAKTHLHLYYVGDSDSKSFFIKKLQEQQQKPQSNATKQLAEKTIEVQQLNDVQHELKQNNGATLQQDVKIVHATFGAGTITKRDGDRLEIYFDDYGDKIFSAASCVKHYFIIDIKP